MQTSAGREVSPCEASRISSDLFRYSFARVVSPTLSCVIGTGYSEGRSNSAPMLR